jgi:TetR/AcrR family transcriptional repressor of nem operon
MRYTRTHKQETRDRVVTIAAKMLREKGPDGVGVAEVMREAELTHGGFYAHFPSKDAFLTEALRMILEQAVQKRRQLTEGLPPREALGVYIDYYVSAPHRDHPGSGCPIVALNSELPRQSKKFRIAFDQGVKGLIDWLAQLMAEAGMADSEKRAAATLAAMVGAVALSRAVSDRDLSDALLKTANSGIKRQLGLITGSGQKVLA